MRLAAIFALVALSLPVPSAAGETAFGRYQNAETESVIEIGPCGAKVCGRVVWAKNASVTDARNPDPALRRRPIVGLTILTGLERVGDRWTGGSIYDPRDGRAYDASLRVRPDGAVELKGCMPGTILCKTKVWPPAAS
jgi:uncharacterized protein (DUF2147 family)